MKDNELLAEMFERDDARALLDRAVGDLLAGRFDPRLMTWLAIQLEKVIGTENVAGEDARDVFKLRGSEGAPSGKHGRKGKRRATSEQIAALAVLARRRFKKMGDADAAVADAVGWGDSLRVWRHYREGGYSLEGYPEDDLIAMAGSRLLSRMTWPKN